MRCGYRVRVKPVRDLAQCAAALALAPDPIDDRLRK
jgi:hypothetical protein